MAYVFEGGIGTATKVAETRSGSFTVGVLVQSNHGQRDDVCIDGIGGIGNNGSGDFVICFSTGNRLAPEPAEPVNNVRMVPNQHFSPLFQATIEATESAILNSPLGATTMTGRNGNTAYALTASAIREVMEACGREALSLAGR